MEDYSKYEHSPAHLAVVQRDHAALKKLIATLPRLAKAGAVSTEAESVAAELDADAVSAVIDRRDVPGRETPLHLAVRLKDPISADVLMAAGADWSLQNEHGWSALQEAVCNREENIAMIIARHYQPLAWAKWCRRLPRIVASANRIRDFYMEITFHFESSVIPFIGRIAPSDTYRIWKRGSNLRADMTLAGFDGFRIQRSDQTFMFLGDGYSREDGNVCLPPGSLIVLSHKEKEITNALEGAGAQPSEAEVAHEVALMSQTNMYRPGIDVTQAELVPHLNWRRQEMTELVGPWKSKVYDMLHVMVSVKSRRVPGAMTDEELFSNEHGGVENGVDHDEYDDVLTPEEKRQLNSALKMGNSENVCDDEEQIHHENSDSGSFENSESNTKDKKSWFGWNKKGSKNNDPEDSKILKKFSRLNETQKPSSETVTEDNNGESKKGKDKSVKKKKKKGSTTDLKHESEYKKGLRPVLWLTPDFPLKTDELVPLLDILANKVKAIRRLRDLLTTKLPTGTFPVKIAIPIVPTIRVVVTFTKFEELQTASEEFSTPLSSPAHFQDSKSKEPEGSTSWISWMKGNRGDQSSDSEGRSFRDETDPFNIPADYTWVDANEKKRRMKAKKAKIRKHKKKSAAAAADKSNENGARQVSEDLE
ncbi:hypothetical protein L1987_36216 [Smallanthus sonchifolius]|uniref:Uncharacterized protein n=1 Tax=Smallanthus sonchifolius TaxID=185202 RepID=A0ACB9HDL8_9ASTR|nr:hypothetical protein L1987_36216 [Smallanthus sonchifolius]